jgi:hypothetical protein
MTKPTKKEEPPKLPTLAERLLAELEAAAKELGISPEYLAYLKRDPNSVQLAMLRAAPASVMQGIKEDARKGIGQSTSQLPPEPRQPPVPPGSGDATPLEKWKAPGIDIIDRMMDAQDRRDRAERVRLDLQSWAMQRADERAAAEEVRQHKEDDPIGTALYEDPSKT